jgi:hypothetical protein
MHRYCDVCGFETDDEVEYKKHLKTHPLLGKKLTNKQLETLIQELYRTTVDFPRYNYELWKQKLLLGE